MTRPGWSERRQAAAAQASWANRALGRRGAPRAWLLPLGVLALAGLLPGCVRHRPKPPDSGNPAQTTLPREVVSRGITVVWQEGGPAGLMQRVLQVQAAKGDLDAVKQSGTLRTARGLLFRDDRPRARFEAPLVEASRDRRRVVARGGVTLHSIDPPGATVTADRVTWSVRHNLVLAEGNVRFVYQPPGQGAPGARGGPFPRIRFDTALSRVRIP